MPLQRSCPAFEVGDIPCLSPPPSSTRVVSILVRPRLSPTLRSISQPLTDRIPPQGNLSPHHTESTATRHPGFVTLLSASRALLRSIQGNNLKCVLERRQGPNRHQPRHRPITISPPSCPAIVRVYPLGRQPSFNPRQWVTLFEYRQNKPSLPSSPPTKPFHLPLGNLGLGTCQEVPQGTPAHQSLPLQRRRWRSSLDILSPNDSRPPTLSVGQTATGITRPGSQGPKARGRKTATARRDETYIPEPDEERAEKKRRK